jgi:uncharacterized SAM-binding protein YcdF (DUF218 family)
MEAFGALLLPSGLAIAFFAAGVLASAATATRGYSWPLLAASGLTTLVFSSGSVASMLMSPLEYRYPVVRAADHPDARFIVALTGWATDDTNMPLSGRVNDSTAYRLLLTLELINECPDCSVVVSGNDKTARIMTDVLVKLGVPPDRLIVDGQSHNTADSARNIAPIVRDEDFFLVTSAGHLSRSLSAMAVHGLRPIPAPTDHKMPRDWASADWTPSPAALAVADLAVHEYLGVVWYRLTGRG